MLSLFLVLRRLILPNERLEGNIKRPRQTAFRETIKRVRVGPCYPRDIYRDPKIGLGKNTVKHNLKLGVFIGIFKQLEDDRYAWIDYKIPSENTILEMPWQPQSGEVKLCIEALEAKDTEEMHKANLSELISILNSGYWDKQLDRFFSKALDSSEVYEEEIERLLRADPRNREKIELFFKNNRNKIYDLIKSSGRLCSLALRIFVDVSEGREALDRMEEELKGEGADRVLMAAQVCGRKLYEKFNLDFKRFLHSALRHESEIVKESALNIMNEIQHIKG
jgi:hypothetical protein